MTDIWSMLVAAFATGFLGSAHCFGMCSGLSGLFAARTDAHAGRPRIDLALAYNAGRLGSYALLGVAAALIGKTFVDLLPQLQAPLRLFSGALIVVIGLQVAFSWRLLAPIEQAGAGLWKRIAPLARRLLPATSAPRAMLLGAAWGFLPCGLVYSVLLIAAASAQPHGGALLMAAFGCGTLPAMLATGLSAAKLTQWVRRRQRMAGILIVLLGIATLAAPVSAWLTDGSHQHHAGGIPLNARAG